MNTNAMINLENVSKSFTSNDRKFTALRNISLNIDKGAYVAIVGKSGSGKSTLLNMIAGIDYPSTGSIRVNGSLLQGLDENDLANWRGRNIGIVFQFFQLIPTLTILENLLLAMEFVQAIPPKQRLTRATELLHSVGIEEHCHKMPAALSGGEQQRAAIARALANDPDIVSADEPTGNLDSVTAHSIHELFQSLADAGKTVIIVTHEKTLEANYDRVINLIDGAIATDENIALEHSR